MTVPNVPNYVKSVNRVSYNIIAINYILAKQLWEYNVNDSYF